MPLVLVVGSSCLLFLLAVAHLYTEGGLFWDAGDVTAVVRDGKGKQS